MKLQLISSVLFSGSMPPPVPRRTPQGSGESSEPGPSPYMGMVETYLKEKNGGDTYNIFMHPLSNPLLATFERVTLSKDLLSKTGMGAVLRQASDMAKPVPGYQHMWTSDPFLEYSATMPSTQEEAETRYAAALTNGMTLEEAQQMLKEESSGTGNSFSTAYLSGAQREREDFKTVAESGTVVTLVTPRQPLIGTENFSLRLTRQNGMEVTLPLNEDARINEYENGYMSLYYPATGTRKTFDAAGNAVDAHDVENWGATGQNIIVNVTGDSVVTDDGNDIIYNIADNTRIEGSGGNKSVFMLGAKNEGCTLDLGGGNNTVFGSQFTNTDFKLGTGKNSLMTLNVKGGSIVGGGETVVLGRHFSSMGIDLPNGSSTIQGEYLEDCTAKLQKNNALIMTNGVLGGVLELGDGNNVVSLGSVQDARIAVGNGDNSVNISQLSGSYIEAGEGNNSWRVDCIQSSTLYMGDGNNLLDARTALYSQINMGDGKNRVSADTMIASSVSTGNGDNSFSVDSLLNHSKITALEGDNSFRITNMTGCSVQSGNGKNYFFVESGVGSICTGSGNDTLYIPNSMIENRGSISLGGERNTVYVRDHTSGGYQEKTWIFR